MFDASLVVQSAISAFNNAALVAPAFFWLGVLTLPLVVMAYFCGGEFMVRIGWRNTDIMPNAMNLFAAVVLIWAITFGGNYDVLRDSVSVLPYGMGAIVFLCMAILGNASRDVAIPRLRDMSWRRRMLLIVALAAVLGMVAMSGAAGIIGRLIPVAALVFGAIVGRYIRNIRACAVVWIVMLGVTTLILMQPEFFRFGQLGALTVVHLGAILMMGVALAAAVAVRMTPARGRVANSVYKKLKWMFRIVAALCVVLFLLTESVPVFLGTSAVFCVMFAMSVYHAAEIPMNLYRAMMGLCLIIFGMITTLPLISAIGALIWSGMNVGASMRSGKFLL
ncbi:hypothetical protein HDR66_00940 [bacterium]|nr:hypothetical protein [bacterium]